ncbi:MAG: acyl-CoA dehydrogenase family protein [Actinobacteria bacterium]|nr:acyl-CoA dehydrogenase family protein [Actinomycetota bacterium]
MLGQELSETGKRLFRDFPILRALWESGRKKSVREAIGLVEKAEEFNRTFAVPRALELDMRMEREPEYFDWEIMRQACKYRFLSIFIPKQLGGIAGEFMVANTSLLMDELCSGCSGIALAVGAHSLGVAPVITSGAMAHWDTVLREIVEGELKQQPVTMAYAITEPSAGTDVEEPEYLEKAKLSLEAKKVKGGYVLNGRKCFISDGSEAKYFTVCAALDRNRPLQTWTTFLVERGMEGFSTPRVELKMGQRAAHAAELLFEDVFVPDSHLLGYEGDGMGNGILMIMAASRGPVGAIATGIARGAFQHFLAWAKSKRNGKRPIEEDRIRMALADMWGMVQENRGLYMSNAILGDCIFGKALDNPVMNLTLSLPSSLRTNKIMRNFLNSYYGKAMINAVLRFYIKDEDMTQLLETASLAKFSCADNAMELCSRALSLMGPEDSEERRWVEKCYRDAKLTQIYEGTNQLNRLVVNNVRFEETLRVEVPRPFKKGVMA